MAEVKPGTGGDHDIPYEERKGNESIVYFTRDLSAEGLKKIYEKISANLTGKIAVKLHTGEKHGPNILPRPWVKELLEKEIPDATIIETNTYYEGDRYTTAQHRETLKVNGWTFAPVDIIDDESHGGRRAIRSRRPTAVRTAVVFRPSRPWRRSKNRSLSCAPSCRTARRSRLRASGAA